MWNISIIVNYFYIDTVNKYLVFELYNGPEIIRGVLFSRRYFKTVCYQCKTTMDDKRHVLLITKGLKRGYQQKYENIWDSMFV